LLAFRDLAPEVRHFEFDVLGVEKLEFTPGQFLSFTDELHGKKITRAYSIASPPCGNRFDLCLNRVKQGVFSPHLFDLHPGDTIEFKGPYGVFVPRIPPSDSVFVAMGTGVAPFRSMLLAGFSRPATLLLGVRHEHGLLYREEFEALARARPDFSFWPTITRPEPGWTGRVGRVQVHLLEAIGERRDIDVYICGLREMVDEIRGRLKELGFERRRIVYEKYN
jgi:CDP-4-dehydro-6-deoxyglucose reductase